MANHSLRQAQLFLDDEWIAESRRVTRVWHPVQKYPEPVLQAEYPWEFNCPVLYGSVLRRADGRFYMWYKGWTRNVAGGVCYAESEDGIHWRKPMLGLMETCGTRQNNVVLRSCKPGGKIDCLTVIDDPEDNDWPLKMLYWDSHGLKRQNRGTFGICSACSKDGINWEQQRLTLPGWYDRFNAVPVRQDGTFVVYGREPGAMTQGGPALRRVWRTESPDLVDWSTPELVMEPDVEDPAHLQFYSLSAFPYESLMLGGLERMHMVPDTLDVELVFSRDGGRQWRRARTRPCFIPQGAPGRFDSDWTALSAGRPIFHHNALWFFYSGRTAGHSRFYPHNHGAIGVATLRPDGFCSLHTPEHEGEVLTPPFTWPGGDLLVNYDARRDLTSHPGFTAASVGGSGGVRVGIRTAANRGVPGYEADHCRALNYNSVLLEGGYSAVTWKGSRSTAALAGKRIRLCFRLRDAHLYAFKAGKR